MSHFEILAPNQVGVCKRNQNGQLGEYQVGCFGVGVGSFFFRSWNDTRRYLVSKTFIQPIRVCCSLFFSLSM